MPDILAPVLLRAFRLALYGLFVAIPTLVTREPVALRIRTWTRGQSLAVGLGLAALALGLLGVSLATPHEPRANAVWWLFGAGYVAETLLFVRYVRTERPPGFLRLRRRAPAQRL